MEAKQEDTGFVAVPELESCLEGGKSGLCLSGGGEEGGTDGLEGEQGEGVEELEEGRRREQVELERFGERFRGGLLAVLEELEDRSLATRRARINCDCSFPLPLPVLCSFLFHKGSKEVR